MEFVKSTCRVETSLQLLEQKICIKCAFSVLLEFRAQCEHGKSCIVTTAFNYEYFFGITVYSMKKINMKRLFDIKLFKKSHCLVQQQNVVTEVFHPVVCVSCFMFIDT